MTRGCPRRTMLAGGAAAFIRSAAPGPARAQGVPAVLVAGASGGALERAGVRLAAALGRSWPGGATLRTEAAGGDDGVTGANQFAARAPAGGTALLLPGAAVVAWIAGSPRVQFDAARWLPVMCAVSGGVLAGRRPLGEAMPGRPLRVALPAPLGPAAACLLGLDLLRIPARPVAAADALAALREGRADAAFMAPAAAAGAGAEPLLTLGPPDGAGADDVPAPALSGLLEGVAVSDAGLLAGWQAIAAAVQLDYALVLAPLADAPDVALWREAAGQAVLDPALAATAAAPGARIVALPGAAAVLDAIATSSRGLLAYRRWLAERLGYQPG